MTRKLGAISIPFLEKTWDYAQYFDFFDIPSVYLLSALASAVNQAGPVDRYTFDRAPYVN